MNLKVCDWKIFIVVVADEAPALEELRQFTDPYIWVSSARFEVVHRDIRCPNEAVPD